MYNYTGNVTLILPTFKKNTSFLGFMYGGFIFYQDMLILCNLFVSLKKKKQPLQTSEWSMLYSVKPVLNFVILKVTHFKENSQHFKMQKSSSISTFESSIQKIYIIKWNCHETVCFTTFEKLLKN